MQKVNACYEPLFIRERNIRYVIMLGGRGAGRSMAASQYVLAKLRAPGYFRCAIMRFLLNDVGLSIFQDIKDRIEEQELEDFIDVRDQRLTFKCGNNKIKGIGFRKSSGDQKSKLKSLANFNTIVIEEADEVSEADFRQLDDSLRTTKGDIVVILLLNAPPKEHWIIKRWFNLVDSGVKGFYRPVLKDTAKEDTVYIHTTFRDNIKNLNDSTVRNFRNYQTTNPAYYYNMIEGLVSQGRVGVIYDKWQPCTNALYESLPFDEEFGLDFGFTNDPAALFGVKRHNNKMWVKEYIYETGLLNKQLSKRMSELGIPKTKKIVADSSEPKSIADLQEEGWFIVPCIKGGDSVEDGVNLLLEQEVYYTEDSTNLITEKENYTWKLDKNKEPTNTPIDKFNHGMDGIRYVVWTNEKKPFVGFV